jgi:hypothetical protein
MRQTRFGAPLPPPRSATTVLVVQPTLGFVSDAPPTNIPLGATPASENWMMREGSLRPRPVLSQHTATANPLGVLVTGGAEIQSSVGSRYNLISGTTRPAYYSAASYSPLSQVSAGGLAYVAWSATTHDRTDIIQIYEPTNDEMLAVWSTTSSYNTLMTWKAGATTFSALTQSPRARWLAPFDNFILAGNIRDVGSAQSKYVQRMQWSDRGNPFSWTPASGSLAGNQDLLDATGQIQRLIAQESRVVIFFDEEIWVAIRGSFPSVFQFAPLDRSVGTPYGKTCVDTPKGIVFLSRDFMPYLLPKEGGAAVPIGQRVRPELRDTIGTPEKAWATYDAVNGQYALYYPARGVSDLPTRGQWLNLETGAWSPMRWDQTATVRYLSAGWQGLLATGTGGISWSDISAIGTTWLTQPGTWASLAPTSSFGQQVTYIGSSNGTVWYLDSAGTRDDGTPRESKWRSSAMGGENPESQKAVNGFRLDYTAEMASQVSVRFSRDQGATFDSAITVSLPVASQQANAVGYPYTVSRYPMFEVSTMDSFVDLYRMWIPMRRGGR